MTRALATCQCKRARRACERTATQEDLRCDVCRAGCAQYGFGAVGTAPAGIGLDGHADPSGFGLVFPDVLTG